MKKITVQDRAEKFINELGKYAVGNFKYWFPFCKLQKNISVIAYDLDRIYKENCIEIGGKDPAAHSFGDLAQCPEATSVQPAKSRSPATSICTAHW